MMNKDLILCIETTTEICSVALFKGTRLVSLQEHRKGFAHATLLTVLIQQVFEDTTFTYQNLAAIALSAGPGSYTGLRIGTATAKGMCYALNIPLLPIPTLKALACKTIQDHYHPSALYVSMMDARRNDVYLAVHDVDLKETTRTQIVTLSHQMFDAYDSNYDTIFVMGNALEKCKTIAFPKRTHFLDATPFSAANLISLAQVAYQNGIDHQEFVNIAYYEPYYLKEYIPNKKQKRFF